MRMHLFVSCLMVSLLGVGCGYHYYSEPLQPVESGNTAMNVADDGSVIFTQDRLEVRLKPMTDEELNRQFATDSRGGVKSTNPYTFGDTEFWEGEKERTRFTVFRLSVKNYSYPKVKIDPAKIVLRAANKREYWSLGLQQMDTYYRGYAIGYRGNEYSRYQARMDLLRRTLFKNEEVFSGQETEGFLVFPVLHNDVKDIEVIVHDLVLRFDFRNEPVETIDVGYGFSRNIGRIYRDGTVKLTQAN